ncbi:MAG: DHH family phosphoesterase [Bacteroidetes bacterium HGW-Bacteroidetes-16]|nr:MAG: DHH family phosphoesterase [Bacteroidetes bacterium HGW-Bacteroidetes-16]
MKFLIMLTHTEKEELKALLKTKKKIVLSSHSNPDGDAIGSLLAMYYYLTNKGHEVYMVVPNKFPEFYDWMPGSDLIINYEKNAKKAQQLLKSADIFFSLDYNALNRIGPVAEFIPPSPATRILIDHHIDPERDKFDYCYSNTAFSSTGELIYSFISTLGDIKFIDKSVAEALYTCIVTDTGSFSFSCNRPETYEITAALLKLGIDAEKMHRLIYDTFSEQRLRLLGFAISNRMIVWDDLHTSLIYLTKADLSKFNFEVGDTEGVVNYPLMMKKVNLSILITEKDNKLRLSFRSKGNFSVNDLARKHFNGGGHRNASGGNVNKPVKELIDELKVVLDDYSKELNYELVY